MCRLNTSMAWSRSSKRPSNKPCQTSRSTISTNRATGGNPIFGDCPDGEIRIDGVCVPVLVEPIVCPDGKIYVNGVCIDPLPAEPNVPECEDGEVLIGNECAPIQFVPHCAEHEILINGVCMEPLIIDTNEKPSKPGCPDGMVFNHHSGACVPNPCGDNEFFIDGDCVPHLVVKPCPDGQSLVNGVCTELGFIDPLELDPGDQPLGLDGP